MIIWLSEFPAVLLGGSDRFGGAPVLLISMFPGEDNPLITGDNRLLRALFVLHNWSKVKLLVRQSA
jgi:hypothetical protein